MAPSYDPSPYEGSPGQPVSGGVAKAGYVTSLLTSLKEASNKKRDEETAKLEKMGPLLQGELQQAQAKVDAGDRSPQAMEAAVKAHDQYDKWVKSIEKTYQPNKSVWSVIAKQLKSHGTKGSPAGAPGAPPPAAGPQGPPKPSGAPAAPQAAAQPPNGNAVYENLRANQAAAVKNINDLSQAVTTGNLQGELDKQKNQREAQQQIIGAIQKFRTGGMDLATAAQQIWDAHDMAFDGGGMKSALDFAYKVKTSSKDPAQQKQADDYIKTLTQGLQAETGKFPPRSGGAPKYPTGEQAKAFERAGVSPNRDLREYGPDEWARIFKVEEHDAEEAMKKAHAAAAVHDGAHQYQQFQAQTKADTETVGVLKSRIGQMEALLANPLNQLTDEQKEAVTDELNNTRSDLTTAYQNIQASYQDIYGGGAKKETGNPPPKPSGSVEGLSPAGQQYMQGK